MNVTARGVLGCDVVGVDEICTALFAAGEDDRGAPPELQEVMPTTALSISPAAAPALVLNRHIPGLPTPL